MIRFSAPALIIGVTAFCLALLAGMAALDRPVATTTSPVSVSPPASSRAESVPSASRTPPRLADGYRGTGHRLLSALLGLVVVVVGDFILAIPVGRQLSGRRIDPAEWLLTVVAGAAAILLGVYFLVGAFL